MGWASGFRAGSELGESILDTYRSARRNRDIKEIEAGLQRQQGDATAEQETQQANIQVMAGQQPGQLQQQQLARNVGLAPAINPQQSMVAPPGQQLAGRATNVPAMGQMSPVGSEAMGLGPAAKGPMGEAMVERERARQLRSLGYTDEANQALDRSLQLQAIDEERKRYATDQEYRAREEGFRERGLVLQEKAGERADLNDKLRRKLTNIQIDTAQLSLDDAKSLNAGYDAYAEWEKSGKPLLEFYETDAWKDMGLKNQNILVQDATGVAQSQQSLGVFNLTSQLDRAQTLDEMAQIVSGEDSITKGSAVRIDRNDDGSIDVVYYDDTPSSELEEGQEFEKELSRRSYPSEEAAMANFRTSVENPALGAQNYVDSQAAINKIIYEKGQDAIKNVTSLAELEASIVEELVGPFGLSGLDDNPAARATLEKEVDRIMGPLRLLAGIQVETGGLDDRAFQD